MGNFAGGMHSLGKAPTQKLGISYSYGYCVPYYYDNYRRMMFLLAGHVATLKSHLFISRLYYSIITIPAGLTEFISSTTLAL